MDTIFPPRGSNMGTAGEMDTVVYPPRGSNMVVPPRVVAAKVEVVPPNNGMAEQWDGSAGGGPPAEQFAEQVGAMEFSPEQKQAHNYKSSLCRHFVNSGSCPRGNNCNFAHGEMELRAAGAGMFMAGELGGFQGSTKVPAAFAGKGKGKGKGNGKGGFTPQQKAAHNHKTVLCKTFAANGFCSYEHVCQFAHGEAELQWNPN
jgi:hypothetical protein